ncbi:MAG: DUF6273 domain-containing protein [Oscillospiraceae bacterium]|nr:DUF6273 domain-containing protein [Oscillospiraceae bacterium]
MKKLITIILTLALVLSFTACGNEGNSAESNNKGKNKNNNSSYDIIQFGGYNWRVLEVRDEKILIIRENLLDRKPLTYHKDGSSITWENSSIRNYLNNEYFNNAFTLEEQTRIIETTVINENNAISDIAGGNDTTDKIFLLSINEAKSYFSNEVLRIAYYANGEDSSWWLRSPGYIGDNHAAVVYADGRIGSSGIYVSNYGIGIRPALWLNL